MAHNPHRNRNFSLEIRIFTTVTRESFVWAYCYLKENPLTVIRDKPKPLLGQVRAYLKQIVEEHGLRGLNKLVNGMPQSKHRQEAEDFFKKYLD